MAQCPFCKGQVNEDLLRFGGPCPNCLIEIPGEEAATDPGEERRKAEEQRVRDVAARRNRRQRGIIVAVMLLVVGGVAAAILMREPAPEPLALNIDEFYIPPFDPVESVATGPDASGPKNGTNGSRTPRTTPRTQSGTGGGASGAPESSGGGDASSGGSSVSGGSGSGSTSTSATSDDPFNISSGPKRQVVGIVLKDPGEIRNMVVDVVGKGKRQLQSCYEARLKQDPSLRGTWEIGWVIKQDGTTRDVKVHGRTTSDSEFEGCMTRTVAAWHFQQVTESQSIEKLPFRFDPSM